MDAQFMSACNAWMRGAQTFTGGVWGHPPSPAAHWAANPLPGFGGGWGKWHVRTNTCEVKCSARVVSREMLPQGTGQERNESRGEGGELRTSRGPGLSRRGVPSQAGACSQWPRVPRGGGHKRRLSSACPGVGQRGQARRETRKLSAVIEVQMSLLIA